MPVDSLIFEKDAVETLWLCPMMSGTSALKDSKAGSELTAGGWNHLKVSSLTCSVTDTGQDLRWTLGWDTYLWPPHGSWASSQHGSWVQSASDPREQGRSTWHFNGLYEKPHGIISTTAFIGAVIEFCSGSMAGDMEPTSQQVGWQGHMVRRCEIGDIVGTIFGKYNQLQGGSGDPGRWELSPHFSQAAATQ